MKLPHDFFDLLRERINIVDTIASKVPLRPRGKEYIGLCPFHQENTPSFSVNPIKKFYHCFGCSAHGDVIKFIAETSGMNYKNVALKLASDYNIPIPILSKEKQEELDEQEELYNVLELANNFFKQNLNKVTNQYLKSRNINTELCKEFSIGFAPGKGELIKYLESKNVPLMLMAKAGLISKGKDGSIYEVFRQRIIFPIKNVYNKIIAFGGRIIGEGQPKYLNSPETKLFKKSETLYGENHAIACGYQHNRIIIVEGYIDLIAMYAAGFKETVASLGTAINPHVLAKLWNTVDEIILCLDNDNAGLKATKRVIELSLPIVNAAKTISFIFLPNSFDPDKLIQEHGTDYMSDLLQKRLSLSKAIWHLSTRDLQLTSAESKAQLEQSLINYCSKIQDKALSRNYYWFFRDQCRKFFSNSKKLDYNTKDTNNKVSLKLSPLLNSLDELNYLEHVIVALIIKFPQLLEDSSINESLTNMNIQNESLASFRDWWLNLNPQVFEEKESLSQLINESNFTKLYNLLNSNNIFLNKIPSPLENKEPKYLWNLFMKKYYLAQLKHEYTDILRNSSDNEQLIKKSLMYQQEIKQLRQEIDSYMLHET